MSFYGYSDITADRDRDWKYAFKLARHAIKWKNHRCLTCGGRLWKQRRGRARVYCDDTCYNRQERRRGRYRKYLREHDEPCVLCGSDA